MQTNKVLRYIVLGGLFLVPFIPLFVANSFFFPFITGKGFAFRIIVEIVTGAWLILALRDSAYLPKSSWLARAFLVFLAVIFIADLGSPNVSKSFWSNYERMEGFVTLVHLFAYFIVLGTMLTREWWNRYFNATVAASVAVSLYGVLQLLHVIQINQGGVRVDATFGNATYLAVYMLFHLFLVAFLWARAAARTLGAKVWYGIAVALQFLIFYFTATRGAMIGLIIGIFLACVLVFLQEKGWNHLRKKSGIIFVALLILVGGIVLIKNTAFVKQQTVLSRLTSVSAGDAAPRLMVWGMAFKGFKEHPIFGWGQESFNYVFNKYYDPGMYSQEQWFDRTHDVFFDWLIAGGVLGLLSYLSLFVAFLYYVWKKGSIFGVLEKSILTGMFAGYFVHNVFVFDNLTSYLLFFMFLAYLHFEYASSVPRLSRVLVIDEGVKNRIAVPIIAVLTIFAVYTVNVPPILAARALIQAMSPRTEGAEVNLTSFKEALSYNSFGTAEVREQLVQGAAIVGNANIDDKIKLAFFNLARSEMLLQLAKTPEDARYQIFMGSFLKRFGLYKDALPYLEKANALSPTKQTILFELGTDYLNVGDVNKALATLKHSYELAPKFEEPTFVYALALLYAGRLTDAHTLLVSRYGSDIVPDERFVGGYTQAKLYDKATAVAELLVKRDPVNAHNYLVYAALLLQRGNRAGAIAEVLKAVAIDPSIKAEADKYIEQIRAGKI